MGLGGLPQAAPRSRHRVGPVGFTLVEIGVAVLLLGLIMVPVVTMFGSGNRTSQMTSDAMVAHAAALELLEQLMIVPFRELPTATIPNERIQNGKPIAVNSPYRFRISEVSGLSRQVTIEPLMKGGLVRFKKVTVRIEWQGMAPGAPPKSLVLGTLVANDA